MPSAKATWASWRCGNGRSSDGWVIRSPTAHTPSTPVLGVHMVGPRVTELIAEAQLITNWEAYPGEVAALIHPHPTLSEGIGEAILALAGTPLHR